MRLDTAPTTAYMLLGERCSRNCAFCSQARDSQAGSGSLSRVSWPAFPGADVRGALQRAYEQNIIQRVCFQVTVSPNYVARVREAVSELARCAKVPICVSVSPRGPEDVAALMSAGADRVTIALDAACERIYSSVKGGSWRLASELLDAMAQRYAGHIGTHLIVGLGETEREMVDCIQRLTDHGIIVALFAFTPVAGTGLALAQPPALDHYRRMQVARWLIVNSLARAESFDYDERERLRHYGMTVERLGALLADGEAFRTSGCSGCNRPYYNERPGGPRSNYPRQLSAAEAAQETALLVASLA